LDNYQGLLILKRSNRAIVEYWIHRALDVAVSTYSLANDPDFFDISYVPPKAPFRLGFVLVIAVVGAILGFILLVIGVSAWQGGYQEFVIAPAIVLVLLLIRWRIRESKKQLAVAAALVEKYEKRETRDIVPRMVGTIDDRKEIDFIPHVLIALQRYKAVVRLGPPDLLQDVSPYTVGFEPVVLGQWQSASSAMTEKQDAPRLGQEAGHDQDRNERETLSITARFRRLFRNEDMRGYWAGRILPVVFVAFFVLIGGYTTALVITVMAALGFLGNQVFEERWLVSPGAVVVRRGSWRSANPTLHRFTRDDAVVFANRIQGGRWLVVVGNQDDNRRCECSLAETKLLLQCWLSQVEPLPVEKYSDFGTST